MAMRYSSKAILVNAGIVLCFTLSGINNLTATPQLTGRQLLSNEPAVPIPAPAPATDYRPASLPIDELATLAHAVCTAGAVTRDLLQPTLGHDIDISSEPVLFRQTEIGNTFSVTSGAGMARVLEVQFISPPGRPGQTSVTSYHHDDTESASVEAKPDTRLSLFDDCGIRAAHQIRYKNGAALYITALDSTLQPTGDKQWLNPEVPSLQNVVKTSENQNTQNQNKIDRNKNHQNIVDQSKVDQNKYDQSMPLHNSTAQNTVTVGLVDSGVNYLLAEIASGLATDDQGNLQGYDFWDMDARPFDANPARSPFLVQRHGTRTASILLREAPGVKLAPYRYPRNNMHRMTDLIAHANELGIRVIGMPLGSNTYADWVDFATAASEHPHILFIVSAGNNGRDIDRTGVYPAAMDIENMLVVTSADDFIHPAERTNYGRISVDYMVPAEHIDATGFNGDNIKVSGSSYAVARVVALAARLLSLAPEQSVDELTSSIRRFSVRAQTSRFVAIGYLGDPLAPTDLTTLNLNVDNYDWPQAISETVAAEADYIMPLQLIKLDARWTYKNLTAAIEKANQIYLQCNIVLQVDSAVSIGNAAYLSDLTSGHALTLSRALAQNDVVTPDVTSRDVVTRVFLARDTKMLEQYDANAFGIGNTRNRPWMTNSLWLTYGIEDTDIALAHELFHIASNSGEHTTLAGNLMQGRTFIDNVSLTESQCATAVQQGTANGVLQKRE